MPPLDGSSPRVRGKRIPIRQRHKPTRIIPARAGQTVRGSVSQSYRADHPRACGANSRLIGSSSARAGSSPRVRGKLYAHDADELAIRIIPARAGQTGPR